MTKIEWTGAANYGRRTDNYDMKDEEPKTEKEKQLIEFFQLSFKNWMRNVKKFGEESSISKRSEKQYRECREELDQYRKTQAV